ncbi:regulatory protein RecX [Paenibacillus physcomitrellae]|uniref:Regulatory protein RecX n=2 Tax=Paenibacillus physcomitrellae TaxID=1619311 RepID=A0ABQ1G927_9BACL|nr:regulatory protein RecX [Paenibacillus physcomitrellae]GGA39127.1 regulatory protein RecX [Paenibacillus physcomitrellae]
MPQQEDQSVDVLASFPEHQQLEITSVKQLQGWKNRQRYRIYFMELSLEVHENTMIKFRMLKGSRFTRTELEEIVQADEKQQAYAAGLAFLGRKPRTRYELTVRLTEKGWAEGVAEQTADRLEQEGYLDDAAYAVEWAQQRLESKGKGKMWIRQELRQKGISKPYIEAALEQVDEETEFESARTIAEKRWQRTNGEPAERKRKVGAFLMRRGFKGSVVSKVIRSLSEADDDWTLNEEADF